jgi:hypothetical protein
MLYTAGFSTARMQPDTLTLEHPALWITGAVAVGLLLVYLLLPMPDPGCLFSMTYALTGLAGYALEMVRDVLQTLLFACEHLPYAWYLLAALTVLALCVDVSKSLSVPFFALFCLIALLLCVGLPYPPERRKPTKKKPPIAQQCAPGTGARLLFPRISL